MDGLERQADEAAARGNYAQARSLLAKLIEGSPNAFAPRLKLAAMCKATGDDPQALTAVTQALAIRPDDFAALMFQARLLDSLGRPDAGRAFGRALAQAPDPAPPHMQGAMAAAQDRFRHWQEQEAEAMRSCAQRAGGLTADVDRMITNAVRLTEPDRAGPTHYCYPGLPERPFHPRLAFPWLEHLEAATSQIEEDFARVAAAKSASLVPYVDYPEAAPLEQWRALNKSLDWTAIHLIERGKIVEENARHCPATMDILQTLPQPHIEGAGPNAMFSLLAPHTHIPPHTGITNTRLVCHLPLIVPDSCWFRVGSDTRIWERGTAWVFDDTVEHEAMNGSDDLRVILIVDLWHPGLDEAARAGVSAVIGAGGGVHGL